MVLRHGELGESHQARRSVGDGGHLGTLKVCLDFLIIYLITHYLTLFYCCCSQVSCQKTGLFFFLKEIFTAQMIMFSSNSHLSYFLMKISCNSVTWDCFYTQRKAEYSHSGWICCRWFFCGCLSSGFLLEYFIFKLSI